MITRRRFTALLSLAGAGLATGCRTLGGAPRAGLAEWLGHPSGTPLLIIHGDDAGIARAANRATAAALTERAIDSASVMVPCPAFGDFARWAAAHPAADVGVHATFTSQPALRWGPVAGAARVPSLVDGDGMLPVAWPAQPTADPREVETELRAQIARARDAGIDVTHLDAHQHLLALRGAPMMDVFARVARDERLPFRFARAWLPRAPYAATMLGGTVPLERMVAISRGSAEPDEWTQWYVRQLAGLPAGLNELFVHLGEADDELRVVTPDTAPFGAEWRARELATVRSRELADAVRRVGAVRIGWREVRDYLRAMRG